MVGLTLPQVKKRPDSCEFPFPKRNFCMAQGLMILHAADGAFGGDQSDLL